MQFFVWITKCKILNFMQTYARCKRGFSDMMLTWYGVYPSYMTYLCDCLFSQGNVIIPYRYLLDNTRGVRIQYDPVTWKINKSSPTQLLHDSGYVGLGSAVLRFYHLCPFSNISVISRLESKKYPISDMVVAWSWLQPQTPYSAILELNHSSLSG